MLQTGCREENWHIARLAGLSTKNAWLPQKIKTLKIKKLDFEEFEKLVVEAINELPENIKAAMKNIAVVIEEKRGRGNLLGLYQGIPQNEWGRGEAMALPDKITIFKPVIEDEAKNPDRIKELVKIVVWHEIAHHFGFEEKQIRKLEKKWRANNGLDKSK